MTRSATTNARVMVATQPGLRTVMDTKSALLATKGMTVLMASVSRIVNEMNARIVGKRYNYVTVKS